MKQKDIDKLYEGLMKDMDKTLGDLKKMIEKQKIAEEQEKLRKIQVGDVVGHAINMQKIPSWFIDLNNNCCFSKHRRRWRDRERRKRKKKERGKKRKNRENCKYLCCHIEEFVREVAVFSAKESADQFN